MANTDARDLLIRNRHRRIAPQGSASLALAFEKGIRKVWKKPDWQWRTSPFRDPAPAGVLIHHLPVRQLRQLERRGRALAPPLVPMGTH